jgi:hypothetical protein
MGELVPRSTVTWLSELGNMLDAGLRMAASFWGMLKMVFI